MASYNVCKSYSQISVYSGLALNKIIKIVIAEFGSCLSAVTFFCITNNWLSTPKHAALNDIKNNGTVNLITAL